MTQCARTGLVGLMLLAAAVLAGCRSQDASGQGPNTGMFTGYEIGNEQDQAEIRKERPDYRPYE